MTGRLTVEKVAALLGVQPSTVRSYAAREQMPKPSPCPTCGHSPTWTRRAIEGWRHVG